MPLYDPYGNVFIDRSMKQSLTSENPELVAEFTQQLLKLYNQMIQRNPNFTLTDGFWTALNFHKRIVLDLEQRLGKQNNVREVAWKQFKEKLEDKTMKV